MTNDDLDAEIIRREQERGEGEAMSFAINDNELREKILAFNAERTAALRGAPAMFAIPHGDAEVRSLRSGALPVEERRKLIEPFTFLGDAESAPPRELIKGLLPADGVAVLGGQSSAGKTFLEIHKAICLATTQPFFGNKIVEKVGTALVAAEGRALIPNRFAAALARAQVSEKLPIAWIKRLPDFCSTEGVKLFIKQLNAVNEQFLGDFGARLGQFVVDTIAASFAMKSEDDNAEATRVCNVLRLIGEETGSLAAAVHHYGKNPESGLRGASAFKGSSDVVLGALADIQPLSGKASNRELVCAKARDGEQGPILPFELQFVKLGVDSDGEEYGSCCVVPLEGGQSRFDKSASLSKSSRTIRDAINEVLDGRGKIITIRAGMASVRAVRVIDVREEFDGRYVVADADPTKVANHATMCSGVQSVQRTSSAHRPCVQLCVRSAR